MQVGLKRAGPREVGVGLVPTQASRDGKELHQEAEMDTERKTSETSVRNIALNC